MEQYIRIGTITKTHGLRGEVKVFPSTDDMQRFSDLDYCFLDEKHAHKKMIITQVRYFKQFVILSFEGITSMDEAESLRGLELYVDRANAVPLEEGEYFIADLIDMNVFTADGEKLGILTDVLQTGANDVYVVRSAKYGKEILIPVIKQCIKSVDIEAGCMTVELLPGLLEL